MAKTGIHALLDLLASAGVDTLFGNPGTTELPLSDALVDDHRFRYILGLQEVPVMAMADGYAMAARRVGVVNLHISCGLGNAMGMLYNAHREGTPLLVTAGQQDRRLKFQEPILWGDMVSVARPWTKWAAEVDRVEDLPAAVRRAIQISLAPPTGPVFLALPLDVQMADATGLELPPISSLDTRVRPPVDALRAAARVLAEARQPAILVGSRVQEAGAVDELVAVAERLGAPVFSEPGHSHGRLGFPADHPLYAQTIPLWAHEISRRLGEFDALLVVGTDLLREYVYHGPEPAIPRGLRLVHLDDSPREIGKNFPVEVGVIGDAKSALTEIAALLSDAMTVEARQLAAERLRSRAAQHAAMREKLRATLAQRRDVRPMPGGALMASLASVLPENVAVVEEAVTTTNTTLQRLAALKNTSGYFGHRGWALGWGLGCALGVKLAWPDRPVLGILGEGAAMYGIQGLWSAARYKLDVTFVICNNAQYQILKSGAAGFGLPAATSGKFVGMDLAGPEIDMVALAEALGVPAERITEPDELAHKVSRSLTAADGPRLFDVPIERTLAGPG
ncbi:MAG: thiamine pyrophosphate-binding protein [Pirellulales bacterium]